MTDNSNKHNSSGYCSPSQTDEELPPDLFISVDIGHKLDTRHQEGRAVSHVSCDPHAPDLAALRALTNTVPGNRRCCVRDELLSGSHLSMMAG